MQIHRVLAVVQRHFYHFKRNWDRLSDAIYWPIMDLIVWGLSTSWLQQSGAMANGLLLVMLTAIVFWQIVWRANQEVSVNLLEETWSRNVVNLFSTPLEVSEWIAGVMLVGVLKVVLSVAVGLGACWLLYTMNLLSVGYSLLPFLVGLIIFGWSLGFLASGLIVRYGRHIQTVAWMMGFVFAPLSAVYYPVSALPQWAQPFSYALPTTYIFEGMRSVVAGQGLSMRALAISFALNMLILLCSITFFCRMFEKRRVLGLHTLD